MDLYADLGVKPDASFAEVVRAFRKQVKANHPDAGGAGDVAKFERIVRAKAVLSDPARRAKYDETGYADDTPDRSAEKVLDLIAKAFESALQVLVGSGVPVEHCDMLAKMKAHLADELKHLRRNRDDGRKLLRSVEVLAGRFTVKKGANQVEAIVAGRIADLRRRLAVSDANIVLFEAAAEALKAYSYRVDTGAETMMGFYALGSGPFARRG